MWDTMKRTNLQNVRIDKRDESQINGMHQPFNKTIEENFLKLKKNMLIQVYEAHNISNGQDQKRKFLQHSYHTEQRKGIES